MRDLTPEEQKLWMAVTKSITPVGEPRRPGIDVPYQILNPIPSKVLDLHGLQSIRCVPHPEILSGRCVSLLGTTRDGHHGKEWGDSQGISRLGRSFSSS